MPARNPEDVDREFEKALNAGNLDALMQLYEPQASLRPSPGQSVQGTEAIRSALAGFLAMKPTISLTPKTLGSSGDVALVTATWKLTGTGPDGKPVEMTGQSAEVVRRQPDGSWRFAIDSPFGLEWGRFALTPRASRSVIRAHDGETRTSRSRAARPRRGRGAPYGRRA